MERKVGAHIPEPTALGKMRKMIPVISWVAAGKWTETGETFLEEDVIEWIETDVKGEHNFALHVKGDSMEPEFKEGEISSSTLLRRLRTAITLS